MLFGMLFFGATPAVDYSPLKLPERTPLVRAVQPMPDAWSFRSGDRFFSLSFREDTQQLSQSAYDRVISSFKKSDLTADKIQSEVERLIDFLASTSPHPFFTDMQSALKSGYKMKVVDAQHPYNEQSSLPGLMYAVTNTENREIIFDINKIGSESDFFSCLLHEFVHALRSKSFKSYARYPEEAQKQVDLIQESKEGEQTPTERSLYQIMGEEALGVFTSELLTDQLKGKTVFTAAELDTSLARDGGPLEYGLAAAIKLTFGEKIALKIQSASVNAPDGEPYKKIWQRIDAYRRSRQYADYLLEGMKSLKLLK